MFGFSFEELLLLFAVCFLVLGPRKTVEMAYRLGIQARKVMNYYDSCKREFGLTDLESVKNSFSSSSQDMEQKINSMSQSLKNAIKSDPADSKTGSAVSSIKNKAAPVDAKTELKSAAEVQKKAENCTDSLKDDERRELDLRIAALESELVRIKASLLLKHSDRS